ncbi:MAG: hypothetical protein WAN68_20385 [Pseudolabrys sp.]|jgi:uncharacterized protein YeaO (DUF488 family)
MKRDPSPQDIDEINMMLKLVEIGWGHENPASRQVYTTLFIPDGLVRFEMNLTDWIDEIAPPHSLPFAQVKSGHVQCNSECPLSASSGQ